MAERKILGQEDALALWQQGREKWNQWVAENPEYNVSFIRVDFSQYRDCDHIPENEWPFDKFHFPNGHVNFSHAQFGEGNVYVSEVP